MTYLPKYIVLSALALSISSCALMNPPKEVVDKIDSEHSSVLADLKLKNSNPNILHFKKMYIERLSKEQAALPDWYYDEAKANFNGLPLADAMSILLKGKTVNIEYRADVELDKKITLTRKQTEVGQILEAISGMTGYQYQINGSNIVWNKYVIKTFPIQTLIGQSTYAIGKKELKKNGPSSSGMQADSLSSTGEEYSIRTGEGDMLSEIKRGVDVILGCNSLPSMSENDQTTEESTLPEGICDQGATSQVLRSDSSILVRALPSQIEAVELFIEDKNSIATRQIRVNLTMLTVEINDSTQMSLDLSIIDQAINGASNLSLGYAGNAVSNLIGGLTSPSSLSLKYKDSTQATIEALSKQGSILHKVILRGVSMNNIVSQLTSINKVNYISDRPLQQTANVGATTGIEQSVAESGVLLYMLPNIGLENVVLHISSSQSALISLETKGEGSSSVESPTIDDKIINTIVKAEPNKPIIIGGFTNNQLQAVFSAEGSLMPGFSRSSVSKNIETVILVEVEYL
jgi:MSHA biogenesis protein MshL